uniref:Uncharacterized protein n=1 Tax=Neovison vison TaxID=452646 RepID=A0A8C7EVN6_NEOVI
MTGLKSTMKCGHMYSRECLLPDTKGHPESRLAKLSSSDTETAEEMNSSDKRHPQLDTYLKLIISTILTSNMSNLGYVLAGSCEKRQNQPGSAGKEGLH